MTVFAVAVQEARVDPHDGYVMGGLPLPPHLLTPGVISEAQPSEERSNQRALLSRHIDNYH